MSDFWNNLSRYPRFFISSLIGLILVIIAPIRNLLKLSKFRFVAIAGIIITFGIVFLILQKMVGL